jgi:hypothetical protein
VNSAIGQSTFKYAGAKNWNSLPLNIREKMSSKFKRIVYINAPLWPKLKHLQRLAVLLPKSRGVYEVPEV